MNNKKEEPKNITSPFNFNEQEIIEVRRSLAGEKIISDALLKKVSSDPLVDIYGKSMFFPIVGDRIKNGERPTIQQIYTTTRAEAVKIVFEENDNYVIKATENSNEPIIAKIIDNMGIGPEQFESLNGYITEKFIEGTTINKLGSEMDTPELMEEIGHKIGESLKRIHQKGILINDQLLSNDYNKSHTIISSGGNVYFIDFGASVDLTDFPNISDEAVYLIINSDTFMSMSLSMIVDKEERLDFINKYRLNILNSFKTKEEVIDRYDGQLLDEGFSFLSQRIQNVESLIKGYVSTQ